MQKIAGEIMQGEERNMNEKLTHPPYVSVVIPTFNRARDLERCLQSLVGQSYQNFEVRVCDDGSTDNTAAIAKSFSDVLDIHYETATNFGGPARPRNRGINAARGEVIAFLDSDDWWTPDKLARSVQALSFGADLVYHDLYIVRSEGQAAFTTRIRATSPRHPMFSALLCTGMSIPNSSVVVRRELLLSIGGVSEDRDLISIEDYDTWIRISKLTEKFHRLPECLGYYWQGGGNISAASPKQQARIRHLYARHVADLPTAVRSRAEAFLDYRIGRIAMMLGNRDGAAPHFRRAACHMMDFPYRAKAVCFLLHCLIASRRPHP